MAENYGSPPVRTSRHDRLGDFVGTWHAVGRSYAKNQDPKEPRAAAEPWVSDDTTARHPGQFFVTQLEDARAGTASLVTHAVIGCDDEGYVVHAFTNQGHHNRYTGRVDGRVWTFGGDKERVRIEFNEDGNEQTVVWEWRPRGEEWLPLCDRTNTRVG